VALIVCGVSFPLTAFMILKAQAFADLLNMSPAAFIAFAPTITLLASVVIIVYVFTSAHLVYSRSLSRGYVVRRGGRNWCVGSKIGEMASSTDYQGNSQASVDRLFHRFSSRNE
jgi:hypothetical protein